MSATTTITYNSTHTVSYVTDKILYLLKEIIREIGLDPGKLMDNWASLERGVSAWLRSQHLEKVRLEISDSKTGALVSPWDLEVIYGYMAAMVRSGLTRLPSGINNIQKAGVVPSQCVYRFIVFTLPGRPAVAGWGPCEPLSLEGFKRYSLGPTRLAEMVLEPGFPIGAKHD